MQRFIIAHDLGTTGNKATLYDADGQLIASAFHGYGVEYAHPRWAEQDPEDWWQAVCISTHRLLAETKVAGNEIACITFSGQPVSVAPSCVMLRRKPLAIFDCRSLNQESFRLARMPVTN